MTKFRISTTLILFGCLLSLRTFNSQAQEIKVSNEKFLTDYDFRIKQFGEFVSRFNFQTDIKGEKIDSLFESKISRSDYLKYLFNLKDTRLDRDNKGFSIDYFNAINEFVSFVTGDSILISKHSDQIIAAAKTIILYNKIPKEITIFLNQEIVNKTMVKWVIASVSADFLDIMKPDTTMVRFIPPSSHELDFANLKRALEDKDHLGDYASNTFVYDPLSVFFFNVNNGSIVINYIIETDFFIFDVPGWCIKVRDFKRSDSNSGWLIDNLWKTNEKPLQFLKSL